MKPLSSALLGTALALGLAGCFGPRAAAHDKRYYALEPTPLEALHGEPIDAAVAVRRIRIAPHYERSGFLYRRSEFDFETDHYNLFLIPPSGMVTEEVRRALAATGLFRTVVGSAGPIDAEFTIEGVVNDLYGDRRERGQPRAVLELELFLIDEASDPRAIRLHRTYRREVALGDATAEALVAGWSSALREILGEWTSDIAGTVPRTASKDSP